MLRRLDELAASGRSFAFESTLSSRTFSVFLKKLKAQGYRINLCYVWLDSIALAQERVALRVKMGGHNIPPDVIARRYARSIQNFRDLYLPIADRWRVYDNSNESNSRLIARGGEEINTDIYEEDAWKTIQTM
ncbi:zeta toxin family protein [Undibacterium amnicola]|uniref:Zeta toxin family protein n=2 Tax=Undibacterium amnicola TaxID=1834038 RepID=A0ABR6XQU4_9BURK|nr:zeta toxin family protein [Undibacterium amnicola]